MGNVFLLLGGSSDVCCAFLRRHAWQKDDRIIAQYFRSKDALVTIQSEIPAQMELRQADFCDAVSIEAFAAYLRAAQVVPTHILHMPAVPIENQRFTEVAWQDAERQLVVQCRSLLDVLHVVLRPMAKAKKGKVVIGLSSCTLNVPPKYLAPYVMAKYALMGLGKALAAEYAPKHITVNMVSPSMMETKFLAHIYDGVPQKSAADNPMKRNARPEDVAELVEYLFSDTAGFVTGSNIPVTGGEIF